MTEEALRRRRGAGGLYIQINSTSYETSGGICLHCSPQGWGERDPAVPTAGTNPQQALQRSPGSTIAVLRKADVGSSGPYDVMARGTGTGVVGGQRGGGWVCLGVIGCHWQE